MRRLFSIITAAFSLYSLCIFAADAPKPSDSLLTNGDFETDADGNKWPDHWGQANENIEWGEENGNRFLRLQAKEPGKLVLVYRVVRVPETVRALELKWRMRVSGLKKGKQPWHDARIMLDFKDAEGHKLKGPGAPNAGKDTEGWVERSLAFLVPAEAQTLEFMPALFEAASGTFDLDDISLRPTDPAPLEEAARAKAAALKEKQARDAAAQRERANKLLHEQGSLISNGNFEADKKKKNWPDDWGHPQGTSWETERENHFLRLASSSPGQTVLLHRLIPLPKAEALELTWRQRVSDLKVGKEPWYDARIMLEFRDAAGQKLKGKPSPPTSRKNTEGWVERRSQFLLPAEAVTLEFMPALFAVERGTLDLDDFTLKPTDAAPLIAAKKAAEEAELAAYVPEEEPRKEKWPPELHVEGNQVLTPEGKPVLLRGVNVVSLEWSAEGEQVMKATLVALDDWHANIIRLPVAQKWWFGQGGGQRDGGEAYRKRVDDVITLTANRGKYVLLDLHQFGAPRPDHVEFWKQAAEKYKNHPAVLFDLFNEPHGIPWEVWKNGGLIPKKNAPADEDAFLSEEERAQQEAARRSVGMQRLLDAVRETGAKNIVLVGGLDWAYDISGIVNGFALDDKGGHGIILSTHIYPWKKNWKDKVLVAADKYPILVGEFGANAKKMEWLPAEYQEDAATWVPAAMGFVQEYQFHWTAFSFHPRSGPHLLKSWDYTPTDEWGAFVKRALAGEEFKLDRLR